MSDAKQVQYVISLPLEIYHKIEKQFPRPGVTSTTSEIEAGYMLGVQAVLKVLREGHVVERR